MNYKDYLQKYRTIDEKARIKAFEKLSGQLLLLLKTLFGSEKTSNGSLFMFLMAIPVKVNAISSTELKYINEFGMSSESLKEPVSMQDSEDYLENYREKLGEGYFSDVAKEFYETSVNTLSKPSVALSYGEITGNRSASDLVQEFFSCFVTLNSNNQAAKEKCLDEIFERFPIPDCYPTLLPPKVVRQAGFIREDAISFRYYMLGAEIDFGPYGAFNTTIRVQFLDSDGTLLDSYDTVVVDIEPGLFYFGKEFEINYVPSSVKILIKTTERYDSSTRDFVPSGAISLKGIKVRKIDFGAWQDDYEIMATVENVLSRGPQALGTVIYSVFYDEKNEIIGGASLEGASLKSGWPEKYSKNVGPDEKWGHVKSIKYTCDLFEKND